MVSIYILSDKLTEESLYYRTQKILLPVLFCVIVFYCGYVIQPAEATCSYNCVTISTSDPSEPTLFFDDHGAFISVINPNGPITTCCGGHYLIVSVSTSAGTWGNIWLTETVTNPPTYTGYIYFKNAIDNANQPFNPFIMIPDSGGNNPMPSGGVPVTVTYPDQTCPGGWMPSGGVCPGGTPPPPAPLGAASITVVSANIDNSYAKSTTGSASWQKWNTSPDTKTQPSTYQINCISPDTASSGDSICDSWKTPAGLKIPYPDGNGYYFYPCGTPPQGADSLVGTSTLDPQCPTVGKKDIYVETDWMQGHKPDINALHAVIKSFANAPVDCGVGIPNPNPSGCRGITLHIQIDEEIPLHQDSINVSPASIAGGSGSTDFDTIKKYYFETAEGRGAPITFVDTGLSQGTQYTYKVRAISLGGQTDSLVSATTLSTPTALPIAPTNVVATAQSSSTILISWFLSPGASSYTITDNVNGRVVAKGLTNSSFVDTGLSPASSHSYSVTAVNSFGYTISSSFSVTTQGKPTAAPPVPSVFVSSSSSSTALVSWTEPSTIANGASSYTINDNGQSVAIGLTNSSFVVTGLSPASSHSYSVTAVNSLSSTPSLSFSVTTQGQPRAAPLSSTDLTATPSSSTSVLLSWTAQNSTASYNIFRGTTLVGTVNPGLQYSYEPWFTAKRQVFHYALSIHAQAGSTSTGASEMPGNDMVVSLGDATGGVGSIDLLEGTFMHELGHNLGLDHGGGESHNCKPVYPSVMSYSSQDITLLPNRPLDYSWGQFSGLLDETHLSEFAGVVSPLATTPQNQNVFGFLGIDGKLYIGYGHDDSKPIDWDNSNTTPDTQGAPTISSMTTNFPSTGSQAVPGCQESVPDTQLYNWFDWGSLTYNMKTTSAWNDGMVLQVDTSSITSHRPVNHQIPGVTGLLPFPTHHAIPPISKTGGPGCEGVPGDPGDPQQPGSTRDKKELGKWIVRMTKDADAKITGPNGAYWKNWFVQNGYCHMKPFKIESGVDELTSNDTSAMRSLQIQSLKYIINNVNPIQITNFSALQQANNNLTRANNFAISGDLIRAEANLQAARNHTVNAMQTLPSNIQLYFNNTIQSFEKSLVISSSNKSQTQNIIYIPPGSAVVSNPQPTYRPQILWVPSVVNITSNTNVTWINIDTASHTVTSSSGSNPQSNGMFNSGLIQPGKSFTYLFTEDGGYHYFDQVHPWLTGIISVGSDNSFTMTDPKLVDGFGNPTSIVSVNKQVQITVTLKNNNPNDQPYAYLQQIQDVNGVTVSLSWITGTLTGGATLNPAQGWTPTVAGTYNAQIFVFQSLDNPFSEAPPLTMTITVTQ